MKLIIAGGREFDNFELLCSVMSKVKTPVEEVVCGGARGADELGQLWALERSIAVKYFPADWDRYGKSAGYRRNEQMADYADALLAFWDGESRGTKHMIDIATKAELLVHVVRYTA